VRNRPPPRTFWCGMSILKVHHRTTYRYSRPVGFGEHRWLFRPRDSQEQRLILA
jgi:hypothetical protein